MSQGSRSSGIGLRREVAIVLPIALLLLAVLSTYSVFSYRSGLVLLVEERREEATRLARRLAEGIANGTLRDAPALRDRAAGAVYFVLANEAGVPVFEGGSVPTGSALGGFEGLTLDAPVAVGPSPGSDFVSALAPTRWSFEPHYLRVDLDAQELARQQRGLRALTWVLLPVNVGLSVLVLLFLRQLLAPYDRLLATARKMRSGDDPRDEVAFLISSFEQAVLKREQERSGPEGEETLELAIGPSLESGFLLLGRQGEVLSLNPAGAELLDCPAPSIPTHLDHVLGPHTELHRLIATAIESGEPIQRQEVEIERDGRDLTLGLSVHPLRRDDGAVRGHLVLFADLTETRRQAEEERLSSSLAQVGELAAGVAHEMRNSLSTFRGYLTLVERAPEEGTIADYLSELRRETDHLQRVLEDFLSFARPESSRPEILNLETVVRRAAVDPALADRRVEIEGTIDSPIRGDAQLLERAIRNLLHNASQAHEVGGVTAPIRVRMSAAEDRAVVEILDRGPGVPDEIRERLFEPFVTGRADGVGLGLSLARRIVDLHGGRIELVDREGGGTAARLGFALAEPPG